MRGGGPARRPSRWVRPRPIDPDQPIGEIGLGAHRLVTPIGLCGEVAIAGAVDDVGVVRSLMVSPDEMIPIEGQDGSVPGVRIIPEAARLAYFAPQI